MTDRGRPAALFSSGAGTMEDKRAFTGRARERKTRKAIWVAEVVSRALITIGGIGTIVAVATVFVFLVWGVIPLLEPAAILGEEQTPSKWSTAPVQMGLDEDQLMTWALFRDGSLQVVRLDTGQ